MSDNTNMAINPKVYVFCWYFDTETPMAVPKLPRAVVYMSGL